MITGRLVAWTLVVALVGGLVYSVMPDPPPAVAQARQLAPLFEHCQNAVKREFIFTRTVTVDDGRLTGNRYAYISKLPGSDERFVGIYDSPPDPTYATRLVPPLFGTYVASGTVTRGAGLNAQTQSYRCKIFAAPPFFWVRSVDLYAIK